MLWQLKKFEELTSEEVYEILKIRTEVFIVEQNCPYQDSDYKDQSSYHLFSRENNKIVAYLRILEKGVSYDEISIGRVLVVKEYRGKSLAKELMLNAIKFIENTLKENEIKISAQAYLIDFYRSVGFKEVSEIYLEDDIPHVDMFYSNKH